MPQCRGAVSSRPYVHGGIHIDGMRSIIIILPTRRINSSGKTVAISAGATAIGSAWWRVRGQEVRRGALEDFGRGGGESREAERRGEPAASRGKHGEMIFRSRYKLK